MASKTTDYEWSDGRKWKGLLSEGDGTPIGMGRLTTATGECMQVISIDSEGRDINRKKFVKGNKSGYLKLMVMSSLNQGKYKLDYMRDATGQEEYVSAKEAFMLHEATGTAAAAAAATEEDGASTIISSPGSPGALNTGDVEVPPPKADTPPLAIKKRAGRALAAKNVGPIKKLSVHSSGRTGTSGTPRKSGQRTLRRP